MEVSRIAVIGGGQIGRQIAQWSAQRGCEVCVREIDDALLEQALATIKENLQRYFVQKGKMTQAEADMVLGRLRGSTDLGEAVAGAELVVEAVPELLPLKKRVFAELDAVCAPRTILASNTSGLSITDIGSSTGRRDRVIGTHFFNPVQVMKLVEVVVAPGTSEDTLETVKAYCRRLDKEFVVVKDSPGFIATRFFVALVNEGVKMLEEGIASKEDIDKAIKLGLNHPMGPIEAADLGMDVTLHCLEYLREELGEEYRPSQLLKKMVRSGNLGWKTGRGFYDYGKPRV